MSDTKFQSARTFAVYEGYDSIPEHERGFCVPVSDEFLEDGGVGMFMAAQIWGDLFGRDD